MRKVKAAAAALVILIAVAVVCIIADAYTKREDTLADTSQVRVRTSIFDRINTRQSDDDDIYERYEAVETWSVDQAREAIDDFANRNNIDPSDYPQEMVDLLSRNPETLEYVLEYPLHSGVGVEGAISLDDEVDFEDGVPLFVQWDMRWGYKYYGRNMMGLSGCGPTCLSMVAVYLTGDTSMNPAWMADYSTNNGYYDFDTGSGTLWTLMSEGAMGLGLSVEEVPLMEDVIISHLENKNPIICIMGPGIFTTEGHFIVISDYNNGYYKINDPNSIDRSSRLWSFDEFSDQINGMWAYSF